MILQSKANSKSLNKFSDYCYDYLFTLHLSLSLSKASSDIVMTRSNGLPWSFSVVCMVPVVRCVFYVCAGFPHWSMWCCNVLSFCPLSAQLANPDSAFSVGAAVFIFLFLHLSHNGHSATHIHLERCVEK